jgi:hypothetical protein
MEISNCKPLLAYANKAQHTQDLYSCAIVWLQQTGTRADKKGLKMHTVVNCHIIVHCQSQTILFNINDDNLFKKSRALCL